MLAFTAPSTPVDEDDTLRRSTVTPDNVSVASFGDAAGSTGNTSETSSNLTGNLLKLHTKGFIGILERLPLAVKIVLLVLFSALGLVTLSAITIGLSAKNMSTTTTASNFLTRSLLMADLLQMLQNERDFARVMLQGNSTSAQIDYLKAIPVTEAAITAVNNVLAQNGALYGTSDEGFAGKRELIDSIRAKVTGRQTTVDNMFAVYHDVILGVTTLIHRSNAVLGYDYDTSTIGVYSEFKEAHILLQATAGVILRDFGMYPSLIASLIRFKGEREVTERVLLNSGESEVIDSFRREILDTPEKKKLDEYIQEVIDSTTGNLSFTAAQYTLVASPVRTKLGTIGNQLFYGAIQSHTQNITNQSIGIIVAVILIVLLFATVALVNSFLFARSIIGPWQRLNAVQESTISKFVPKGFLSLMGWKTIAEAALGKYQEKEVTIVVIRIANFSKMEQAVGKENPSQLYDFVNTFLAYVGPFIRNNSGYIDKFNSDHFVSIFQKDKKAIKAALEIQQSMANFNKMQTAFSVVLRVSIVSGKTVMGTIGENERMESTSISTVMRMAMKLQKVAKRANAAIITTKDTLSKLQNPKSIPQRYLGNVKLRSETLGCCDLFEVMSYSEPVKIKTREHFTKGVRCLHASRFQDALSLFESVVQANPADTLAIWFRDVTKSCLVENVKRLTELTVSQVLQTPALRCCLEQMCIQERSTENMNLLNEIQGFKEGQSPEQRRSIATRICDEFLNVQGKQAVNLSEEQVAAVRRVVLNTNALLTPLLFADIEAHVEHVMVDTVKRLKHQQQFKLEFLFSCLSHKMEEIDLLSK